MFDFIKNRFTNRSQLNKDLDELKTTLKEKEDDIVGFEETIRIIESNHAAEVTELKRKSLEQQKQHVNTITELQKTYSESITEVREEQKKPIGKKPAENYEFTEEQIGKKVEKRIKDSYIMNENQIRKFILPDLEKIDDKPLPEILPYFNNTTNSFVSWQNKKQFYIMIDTSAIFTQANNDRSFDDNPLKKLLNQIHSNNNLIPIITKELRKEYIDVTNDFLNQPTSNTGPNWVEKFPVPALYEFVKSCYFEPTNTNYTNQHKLHFNSFEIQLTAKQKDELDKSDGGEWDRKHAAKALALNALLISEDSGLLQLNSINNDLINLKCYPLLSISKRGNIKNYNRPISEFLVNNKII